QGARPVPGSKWSVLEVARHVLSGFRSYRNRALGGAPMWKAFATSAQDNDELITSMPERELTEIAAALPAAAQQFADACTARGDSMVPWHEETSIPGYAFAGLGVGEVLVHGRDVAKALGVGWKIDRRDATVVSAAVIEVVRYFVDERAAAGFSATYELRLRAESRYTLTFADGVLSVSAEPSTGADCRISADPEAFLLVGYGRTPLWQPIVKGRMLAWGRRPWLALRLPGLLRNP
ncbi:MAG: hypothetical protein QOG50_3535, partial [Actinomycetota bacterium]|nr:hypothetical protein [Actinomycetota bacterium]